MPDFSIRDSTQEILDDFNISGKELEQNLDEIEFINKWLGGNNLVIDGLKKVIFTTELRHQSAIKIADIGCGSGDVLRKISEWGDKQGLEFQLDGYDANSNIVDYAISKIGGEQNIRFYVSDIMKEDLNEDYDLILMNLFLHHFENDEILNLLRKLMKRTRGAIVINDLHRHPLAYYSFLIMSRLLSFSKMSQDDGALSVRRAFTKRDLMNLINNVDSLNFSLRWKWAFRYQLILFAK